MNLRSPLEDVCDSLPIWILLSPVSAYLLGKKPGTFSRVVHQCAFLESYNMQIRHAKNALKGRRGLTVFSVLCDPHLKPELIAAKGKATADSSSGSTLQETNCHERCSGVLDPISSAELVGKSTKSLPTSLPIPLVVIGHTIR